MLHSFDIVLGAAPFRSRSVETVGPWLGLSDRRKAQSSSATNLGSRLMHAGLEKWEELVRRYERSKSCGTTAAALDEDIKTASLEALVPSELKQHLATNRARLTMYGRFDVKKSKPTLKPAEVNSHPRQLRQESTSDPMEVDNFGKGGKKGKKGKGDGKSGKKEGQHQNQSPNPSKEVVC